MHNVYKLLLPIDQDQIEYNVMLMSTNGRVYVWRLENKTLNDLHARIFSEYLHNTDLASTCSPIPGKWWWKIPLDRLVDVNVINFSVRWKLSIAYSGLSSYLLIVASHSKR